MRNLVLILTARCNLACSYCYQAGRSAQPDMSWEVAQAAIDLLLAVPPARANLAFTGGEPLLSTPLLLRCVEYAHARTPPGTTLGIAVSTNGMALTESLARFLASRDVELQVSYDGAGQEQRAPGTGRPVEAGLRRLAAFEPEWFRRRVRVAVTLTPRTLPVLAESVEGILRLGVGDVSISAATGADWPPGQALEHALDRELQRIASACAPLLRQGHELPVSLLREPPLRDLPAEGEAWCSAASPESVAVAPDGLVWGCPSSASSMQRLSPLGRKISDVLRLGNVQDPVLPSLLAGLPARARAARALTHRRAKRSELADCGSCPYLLVCTPCALAAARATEDADPDVVPAVTCVLTRAAARARASLPRRLPFPALLRELEGIAQAVQALTQVQGRRDTSAPVDSS